MIPERWKKVKQLLEEALELVPEQRQLFLDSACNEDRQLRLEVESLLLEENTSTEDFLQSPVYAGLADLDTDRVSWVGRQVGSYKITEKIGEGGMGAVYLAARADQQYQKQVAIKIVKQGLDTPLAVSRFRAERQILADLDHPNIARLLDGGTTDDGFPYVVMELIEGQPIDQYCATRRIQVDERLQLFRKVCLAVQYAHQHLIVHRDLKPGNILVRSDGVPKLLDFGIAKILDPDSSQAGVESTVSFVRMLTPEYASPEQVRGEKVTTASDVYSLGVILFVLLTGRLPVQFDYRTPEAIVRLVCETEPPKPSTAVLMEEKDAGGNDLRGMNGLAFFGAEKPPLQKLSKQLRGDLDNIVLMALRKEPQRRYSSAQQLAEDIQRYLEDQPVLARKDTTRYRASKFVARHAKSVTTTVVVSIVLVIALVATAHEARVARQQRARAERRFNDVRNLANSLIFEIHDGIQDLPGATSVRKLLVDRALRYLDSLASEPGSETSLQRELAVAYDKVGEVQGTPFGGNLGDTEGAAESYRKALNIRQALTLADPANVDDTLQVAVSHRHVAAITAYRGNFEAVGEAEQALAAAQSVLQKAPTNATALAEVNMDHDMLAGLFDGEGNYQRSLMHTRAALPITEQRLSTAPGNRLLQSRVAIIEGRMGFELTRLGLRQEAQDHFLLSIRISEQLAKDATDVERKRILALMLQWFAGHLLMQEDVKAASRAYRRAIAILEPLATADPENALLNFDLANDRVGVGVTFLMLGDPSRGLTLLQKGRAMLESSFDRDPSYVETRESLGLVRVLIGDALVRRGEVAQALESYKSACPILEGLGEQTKSPRYLSEAAIAHARIGTVFAKMARPQEATVEYDSAIHIVEPIIGVQRNLVDALYAAAEIYADLGKLSQQLAKNNVHAWGERVQYWRDAKSWYQRSLETWQAIQNPSSVAPYGFACEKPQAVMASLGECDGFLNRLNVTQLPNRR